MLYFVLCTSSGAPSGGHSPHFIVILRLYRWNLSRFVQVFAVQPWSRLFLSTAIDHLIKDASGGGTTSEREPGPVPCEDMLREDGQTISLYSFILVPMPPNCHHTKGWLQPFNPPWNWWLSQHLPSFCIPWCQPWRFNGPFWNSVWLLVWFPSAATIKWRARTFQPTIKLVIEPASAILLHSLMPALAFQWAILE